MIHLGSLVEGNEYYFYAHSFFWSGFFVELADSYIRIKNGHLYSGNNLVCAYDEAFLDLSQLIGFALT